jgi:hypothetical protein
MLARDAPPAHSFLTITRAPARDARQAQKSPAWHEAKRGRGSGAGLSGLAARPPNATCCSATGQVDSVAGNSGRAMALGVESFPMQTMGSDSGDSGEDVSDIEHGLFLPEKSGGGMSASP